MKTLVINDIFPLADVPDNSVYLFSILLFTAIAGAGLGIYRLYIRFTAGKESRESNYIKILKNCDFTNAKQSAYQISFYGRFLAETEEEKEAVEDLVTQLSSYKYTKETAEVPDKIREQFQLFIDTIEHRDA